MKAMANTRKSNVKRRTDIVATAQSNVKYNSSGRKDSKPGQISIGRWIIK